LAKRLAGPMGLDGLYRKGAPARYGIDAAKGRWLSEHVFEIERRILGHGEAQTWTLSFEGNGVDVSLETTDGFRTKMHGEESN
jgi:hypothetical protein